jgi:PBSX family phage terminase large subunit
LQDPLEITPELLETAQKILNERSFRIEDFLFKEQLEFVKDPARFATAVCSVRAGKTTACAADLVDTALSMPGTTGLYITLARSSAKRIVWPELHRIIRDFGIDAKFNEAELSIAFASGSRIYCSGANTEAETEKLRGLSNVALAYVDESQAFRSHLKELIDDVLVKRLYDTNGRCRLIGTPGPIPAGYFYDASQSSSWSQHAWTLHNNPWIERKSGLTVSQLIQQDMDRKGVGIDDPAIQRECFGRWALDPQSLILEYNAEKNHYENLPKGHWQFILGMDFGFNDADAFSVLGWTDTSPDTYLIEEVIKTKQTYEQMEANFLELHQRYQFLKVKGDPGGGGKKLIESLRARYKVPFEVAEKTEKVANLKLLNNALRTGRFKARKTSRFAQDCNLLERDLDKSTPDRIVIKGHSDSIDSVLYPFKESPAYYYTPPSVAPKPGSPEHDKWVEKELERGTIERIERERNEKRAQSLIDWNVDSNMVPDWNKW